MEQNVRIDPDRSKHAAIKRIVYQGELHRQPPQSTHAAAYTPMQALSPRQRQTLEFVREYVSEYGTAPARPEIARALGIRHVSTIDSHLIALMRKGWVELKPGAPRYIRLLREDLPVVVAGPIAAGEPILAEGRVTARLPRSARELFRPPPDYFLQVHGDSMDRLGLRTGTIVAVKAQAVADNHDVVVARFDDEVTLKRFVRLSERRVELRPESTNPEHRVIKVDLKTTELNIDGVAVGALISHRFNPLAAEPTA